jgi:hypothetical protein
MMVDCTGNCALCTMALGQAVVWVLVLCYTVDVHVWQWEVSGERCVLMVHM